WRRLSNRLETAVAFRSGVVEPVRLARMPVATPTRTMTPDPGGTAGLGAGCRRALLAGQVGRSTGPLPQAVLDQLQHLGDRPTEWREVGGLGRRCGCELPEL